MNRIGQFLLLFSIFATLPFLTSCNQAQSNQTEPTQEATVPANITVDQLKDYEDYTLIDVRTPQETAEGTIGEPMIIDYMASDFQEKVEKLDKDGKYILYCRSGTRSGNAQKYMKSNGFKHVINLEGGYSAYEQMKKE